MSDPAGQPAAEVALRANLTLIFEAMRAHGVKTVKVEYEAKEGWRTTLHGLTTRKCILRTLRENVKRTIM
ncbi:hypothetical protein FXF46_16100 (plasmid) [Gluconobacter thailandicus]|uniref:Uncharacterized protein n=1 Tax=Gluconobacter thailandicus TaxID=257438 RepID=A0AAP9EVF2_GLUTH|nr:hypothetical protein FXF46_16100 [Gluconobacter thailandicus]